MAVMIHIMLIVFLSLCIRKKEFIQPDGISITQLEEDIGRTKEMYAFSAIWCFKQCNGSFVYQPKCRSMCVLLLLICVLSCPGPFQNRRFYER